MIGDLLGAGLESEKDRLERSRLPRTTYQEAKKRIYAKGWVFDRYIPDPVVFGVTRGCFIVAHPYADQLRGLSERWAHDPRCALLWSGGQSVLGVFFHRGELHPSELLIASSGAPTDRSIVLDLALGPGSIPIYFDFEGAWANLQGQAPLWNYPRPLCLTRRSELAQGLSDGMRRKAQLLVQRASPGGSPDRAPHRMGPYSLPRSERRCLSEGWVTWRVLPSLGRVPGLRGSEIEAISLVAGELRGGSKMPDLYRDLAFGSRVFPFLMAGDGRRVLLGFLASRPQSSSEGRARAASAALTRHLERVAIVREPLGSLRPWVDHRYESLVAAPNAVAGPRPPAPPGLQGTDHPVRPEGPARADPGSFPLVLPSDGDSSTSALLGRHP